MLTVIRDNLMPGTSWC